MFVDLCEVVFFLFMIFQLFFFVYSEYVLLLVSKFYILKIDLFEINRKIIEKQVKDMLFKFVLMVFNIIGCVLYVFFVICYFWNGNIFKNFCLYVFELSLVKRGFGSFMVYFVDLGDCYI